MFTLKPDPENSSLNLDLPRHYETYLQGPHLACAVEATLKVIHGRWKVLIFRELLQGTKRFNELNTLVQGITHKVLTEQLREMEQDGLVHRENYQQSPPKVEYSLTPLGQSLHPVIDLLHRWGLEYLKQGKP